MFTSVAGLSVLVTGGSKGIGRGIARVFARAGANVTITGRDERGLAVAAEELAALSGMDAAAAARGGMEATAAARGGTGAAARIATVAADVSRPADCRLAAQVAVDRFGGLDVLCANAGVFPETRLADLTESDVDTVLGINVKGTIFSVQACVPALAASGRGRVILTSSITGPLTGFPGWTHYGASKAAQLGFLRTAAIELSPHQITVNAVLPGNISTEGIDALGPEYRAAMEASIPLGRMGDVEDIGNACLFLATLEAGYITGQTLVVDGGQVLPESMSALQNL